jgi:putative SOS response-associated peptidase YedK
MCNLYSLTTAKEAMRGLFDVDRHRDWLGNTEPLPAIWPKHMAPVVRLDGEGERELLMITRVADDVVGVSDGADFEKDRKTDLAGGVEQCPRGQS